MPERSTEEVFRDHLALADAHELETDISRNFSPDCVLLTSYGVFRGHEGVREAAQLLDRQLGENSSYVYPTRCWERDVAFLEWTGEGERATVRDGADSFLIRDGRIEVMTIHYTVEPKPS